jgi:hypothetical protein
MSRGARAASSAGGSGGDGGLRQWLINQNFYMEKGADAKNATHLLMTGGKLCVADDQYDTFLRYYADDLARKSSNLWWSLHENATRYSRVYFDFDIGEWAEREGAEMSREHIMKFVRILQKQVLAHFPSVATRRRGVDNKLDHAGLCIVLAAPTAFMQKFNEKEQTMQWRRKTGLHIIFPYLYADLNQLLQLRTATIDALDRESDKFPAPDKANSWAAVIDEQVYTNNAGLRMPGSDKFDTCDACRKKRSAMCSVCNGRERVRIERPYWPIMSLDATGASTIQWQALRDDPLRMLQLCTIRKPYQYVNNPPFVVPPNAAVYADTPIIYTVDTQYILDNLPDNDMGSGVVGSRGGSLRNSTDDDLALPRDDVSRTRNPGTSWTLAAREGRGSKRSTSSAMLSANPITGAKKGTGMSAGARADFAASRELQHFEEGHFFCEQFQAFLRSLDKEWPEYGRICVLNVKRSIPNSFRSYHRLKPGEAETPEALRYRKQITDEMTSIDDPRPCIYLIAVKGQGSRYCHNVGREHSTSKIYFYANSEGIMQRCFCKKRNTPAADVASNRSAVADGGIPNDDLPFCSAYSSKPIKWTNYPRGYAILQTFFNYRRHGAIDQPTFSGSLPTIRRPEGSSRNAPFSNLIDQIAKGIEDNEEGDADDNENSDEKRRKQKEDERLQREEELAEYSNILDGPLAQSSPWRSRDHQSTTCSTSPHLASNAPNAAPHPGPLEQQSHRRISTDESDTVTPEELARLLSTSGRAGVFDEPIKKGSGGGHQSVGEIVIPSLPLPTSLEQAHQQAVTLMTRNLRGQSKRIERFTGGLPRRDDIAPELLARLAPPPMVPNSPYTSAPSLRNKTF